MGESAAVESADNDATTADGGGIASNGRYVIAVAEKGDIILDITFETSRETLKKARSAAARKLKEAAEKTTPKLSAQNKIAYRVSLDVLKRNSDYFSNLLSNSRFKEASYIAEAHEKLKSLQILAGEADAAELPWIEIVDDDEATNSASREIPFEDMLRIIHKKPAKTTRITMSYLTTIAIIADRFDCAAAVSRSSLAGGKFKWPLTNIKAYFDEYGRATDTEEILRRKILVALLLGQPVHLHLATRELLLRGSSMWNTYSESNDDKTAAWWNLPQGLEYELQYRRECIINSVASIQRHFLDLYSSKDRQCKLGYDSSAACDSFQLGQMVKFLVSKNLVFLLDYSTTSLESVPDVSCIDIQEIVSSLRQCPNYQVDKHHTNCGLRIRIEPILDYLRTMLSSKIISIQLVDWKKNRADASWAKPESGTRSSRDAESEKVFNFTRAVANDQRLRYEGALYADKMAKELFTSKSWNWTPES